jgi:hypothetical protein
MIGNPSRRYCSEECRDAARHSAEKNPSPEEIKRMCNRIREEGGEQWERTRSCFPTPTVEVTVVAVETLDI